MRVGEKRTCFAASASRHWSRCCTAASGAGLLDEFPLVEAGRAWPAPCPARHRRTVWSRTRQLRFPARTSATASPLYHHSRAHCCAAWSTASNTLEALTRAVRVQPVLPAVLAFQPVWCGRRDARRKDVGPLNQEAACSPRVRAVSRRRKAHTRHWMTCLCCWLWQRPRISARPASIRTWGTRAVCIAGQHEFLEDMSALGTGILEEGHASTIHSLGLGSQLPCLGFPSGEAGRGAQVKRDIPGMRGGTTNQTTRKRRKIRSPSIVQSSHKYSLSRVPMCIIANHWSGCL